MTLPTDASVDNTAVNAKATIGSRTEVFLGTRATVTTAGDVALAAQSTNAASANTVLGAGGLGAGVGASTNVAVTPRVLATVGERATVNAGGNVRVAAESHRAKVDVSSRALSVAGVSVGVIATNGQVAPVVDSHIGSAP